MGEREHALEEACQAAEAWAQAEEETQKQEERHVGEEEDHLTVEQDLHEEGGPSWERAPWQRLFLPSSDSARSPEEEEEVMAGPSQDKGKGRGLVPEDIQGEVTGVICDLCEKKGIPCRWGKVSIPTLLLLLFCFY